MSWLYTLVFTGLLFSTGTDPVKLKHSCELADTTAPVQQDETERIEKTFPLNPSGRVSLTNVNGSITLTAWDRNEVALVAVKTADSKERLADIDIKIDAGPEYLSVDTDFGNWHDNGKLTVDYDLKIPRGAMLNEIGTVNGSVTISKFTNFAKVSSVNGNIRATNLRGTANLSTVNGEVTADYDMLEAGTNISLNTVNGSAGLIIPSDSNATVKAESVNGNISNDFNLPVRKGKYVGSDLRGKIGSGEVSIKLDSVNGPLSLKRRNDGRPVSPVTNLLPPKGDEDRDTNNDNEPSGADLAKMNREITRATADAQRQATRETQREMAKIRPEVTRINADAIKAATKAIDDVDVQVKDAIKMQTDAMGSLRDAIYMAGVPRVSTKSDSIQVKGTPKVSIDARESSVRIHGWDKQEVQYSVTQFDNSRNAAPVQVSENHNDSSVSIKIISNEKTTPSMTRIDVFVPKKSNIKVVSNGEIRLEGVSGELEVTGEDEPVNIRDSQGKLTVTNGDGRVRVIGFDGDVNARTSEGEVYLEGNFTKLTGKADGGDFTVTLPSNVNADISANTDVGAEGFDLVKRGSNMWRLGSGGAKFEFNLNEGDLHIRNSSLLSQN